MGPYDSSKTLQHYKFLLGFFVFTALCIALYVYIGKFWHLSTNFSQLNFTKNPAKVLAVSDQEGNTKYLIGYQNVDKKDSITLIHKNYFTDHFEQGDTLSVYVSKRGIRVPKIDATDHYIWFLLFCFGICAYTAAIYLRKHLFRTKS